MILPFNQYYVPHWTSVPVCRESLREWIWIIKARTRRYLGERLGIVPSIQNLISVANAVVWDISLIFARRVQQHCSTKHGHRGACSSQRQSGENKISSTALLVQRKANPHTLPPIHHQPHLKWKHTGMSVGVSRSMKFKRGWDPWRGPHGGAYRLQAS